MIFNSIQPRNETVPHGTDRVPSSLRRFGAGLVEQARLRAKFATAVAVASGAVAIAAPALAEEAAKPPSASDSLFIVTDRSNPLGVQVTPETDLTKHIDITVECGADCKLELRCPGGKIDGIIFQERTEDGGISAIVDKSRGRAGLATCPGDKKPFPFVVPEYMALPPLSPIPPPETSSAQAAPEGAASQPDDAIQLLVEPSALVEVPEPAAVTVAVVEESFALNAGVEVPLTSTHDFMREPGVFVEATGHPFESLAGARGVLRAAWNPIAMQSAGDDARFHPRNPSQRLYGNAFRATGGLAYPHEFARSGGFSLDGEVGLDAGLAVLSVPRRKDAGIDKDGYLADIPGSDTITAIVEGHGGLAANFGKRLRVALGLRYGQSPFAVQTKAGAREKAHANFTSVNAGLGVQF